MRQGETDQGNGQRKERKIKRNVRDGVGDEDAGEGEAGPAEGLRDGPLVVDVLAAGEDGEQHPCASASAFCVLGSCGQLRRGDVQTRVQMLLRMINIHVDAMKGLPRKMRRKKKRMDILVVPRARVCGIVNANSSWVCR